VRRGGSRTRWPPISPTASPVRVNRAPALTLLATVVAERLGHPPKAPLTLGRFVAGSSACAKARRLGINDEKQDAEECHTLAAKLKPKRQAVHLLCRDIPVLAADDGTLRAEDGGKQASAKRVQSRSATGNKRAGSEGQRPFIALRASSMPPHLVRWHVMAYWPGVQGIRIWRISGDLGLRRDL
jgi:hypothetical protein